MSNKTYEQERDEAANECAGWVNPIAAFKAGSDWAREYYKANALRDLLAEPIEYARSRPDGERGWKNWLDKVEQALKKPKW